MLNKLGEELKEARLKIGATLQQMAAKTRIDLKFLEALENGNFSFLPELYVKAFLREYASYVGLDENLILKKYEYAKLGKIYDEKLPITEETKPEEKEPKEAETKKEDTTKKETKKEETKKSEKKHVVKHTRPLQTYDAMPAEAAKVDNSDALKKKRVLLGMVTGGAVILIALVYFLFFNNNSQIIVTEKPIDEVIEDNKRYIEEEPLAAAADTTFASVVPSTDSLYLTIKTTDTSWVRIILDDKLAEEFILFPKGQKTVTTGKNFKITFGRSSAISLALNDKAIQFSPGELMVSHVLIDSNGITYLKSAPEFGQGQNNEAN
ncbi:MAG: DUF4115 domain-containing protein [Ignavibacteriaceae bacterium]